MEISIKKDCWHYSAGKCKVLQSEKGINCAACKCSFYETLEEYNTRLNKFYEKHPDYKANESERTYVNYLLNARYFED